MRTLARDVITRLPRKEASDALQTLLALRP